MVTRRRTLFAAIATAFAFSPFSVSAQFTNGGFELPAVPSGGVTIFAGGSSFNGWSVLGVDVDLVNTLYTEGGNGVSGGVQTFNSHSGLASLDLTGSGNTGLTNGVQQSLATVLGLNYTVSFWLGKATGGAPYSTASVLDVSINGGSRTSFTNSNNSPVNGINWQQFSFGFTATGSSTLVSFFNGTALGTNNMVGLDDVTITSPTSSVPEPGSMLLVAGGLAGIFGVTRRRRN